jgi:uracil-DNA glycosylase family 4
MFTGDGSGQWLIEALHAAGFANQPAARHRRDGLRLLDAYITAAVRCAPPANKPTREEFRRCRPFFEAELGQLARVCVVVALGRVAWDAYLGTRRAVGEPMPQRKPAFAHGASVEFSDGTVLLGSYHPSQQNTFTGKLTRPMLIHVFRRARALLNAG